MVLRIEKLSQFNRPKQQAQPAIAQDRESILAELGTYLQKMRIEKSQSLEEIGGKTLIPVRLLKAIEAGQLDRLPEPVYIQAFLRRYADALGVNGTEFASTFPITTVSDRPSKPSLWNELNVVNAIQPIHLYFLYIGIIILAVSGLSARLNSSSQMTQQPPRKAVTETEKSPKPILKPVQAIAKKPAIAPKGVDARVTLKSESWVRVNADGTSIYEGTLAAGTKKNWQAQKTLEIVAGNAGGVLVAVNGTPPKTIGADGEVQSATFNAQEPKVP